MAIVERALTLEKEMKERSKKIIAKIMQRRLRAITFQKAKEYLPILLLKNGKLDSTIIISHFGGTNNIIVHCTCMCNN